ncbi:MAG: biopolymer transporter ExbD [Acidaminococcaceae bacterium]|nr:biopolymer transporter ExbD [Acidaminococcaceae bacterium]
MKLKTTSKNLPEIIIIPMIDIMFFLLVFFMLGSIYMTEVKTVSVNLPNIGEGQAVADTVLAITIDENNDVYVGDKKVPVAEVGKYAQTALQNKPQAFVFLQTDKNSRYGDFAAVIKNLKQAGVTKFGIATE